MLSRVLGLVREQVMAGLFGAGLTTDAFNVAFRIPNLLRDLFAEGAMSSAFVPIFTEYRERRGQPEAWALGRQVMVSLAVALVLVCVAGWIAAPWLVRLFAPGFDQVPGKLGLTVTLTRVMLPFLPLVALAAACMGMLNAVGRFAAPALAPAWMNVGMVGFGLLLIPLCERLGQPGILAMAIGVVMGGLAQFVTQVPALLRAGFRFGWETPFRHPGVVRVGALMLPATIGLAATQFNLFFSTLLASLLEQGSVSWLWYAFRLMQLPIGVFGVALATVSLPALSRAAVARDLPALKTTLSATVRLVFVLTVPAALWLAAMSRPLVALLYEHGRFVTTDTTRTADALVMYCAGLPAFAAVGVFTRCFYALGDTRTPVRASFVAVGVNVLLNLALMQSLAHLGLALATSITSIVNLAQLAFYLRRRIGLLEGRRIARTFGKVVVAGTIGAVLCGGGAWVTAPLVRGQLAGEILVVVAGLAIGAAAVFATMRALRVEELAALEDLASGLWRRLRGR
jgi:putative peptidoglycan lipid II flippase